LKETGMIQLNVPDMTCGHCVSTITKAVKELDSGARVEASVADHMVRVESKASQEEVLRCIADAGYTPRAA
jgi:copper chaperone